MQSLSILDATHINNWPDAQTGDRTRIKRLQVFSRFMQQAFFVASSNVGQEMQILLRYHDGLPKFDSKSCGISAMLGHDVMYFQ